MKKFVLLFATALFVLASCEKDEDESSYEKSQLMGKWEQVAPVPQDETCDDYKVFVEFTDTELKSISACSGSESSMTLDYTFDGKKVSYNFFFDITMEIIELTDTKMVTKESVAGVDGSDQFTYERAE